MKRAVVRLQLDGTAKDRLDFLCQQRGMTQISLVSRLVEWFADQEQVVQSAILAGMGDQLMEEIARRLLRKQLRNEERNALPRTEKRAK